MISLKHNTRPEIPTNKTCHFYELMIQVYRRRWEGDGSSEIRSWSVLPLRPVDSLTRRPSLSSHFVTRTLGTEINNHLQLARCSPTRFTSLSSEMKPIWLRWKLMGWVDSLSVAVTRSHVLLVFTLP